MCVCDSICVLGGGVFSVCVSVFFSTHLSMHIISQVAALNMYEACVPMCVCMCNVYDCNERDASRPQMMFNDAKF